MCRYQGVIQESVQGKQKFVPIRNTECSISVSPCAGRCAKDLRSIHTFKHGTGCDDVGCDEQCQADMLQEARDYDFQWKQAELRRVQPYLNLPYPDHLPVNASLVTKPLSSPPPCYQLPNQLRGKVHRLKDRVLGMTRLPVLPPFQAPAEPYNQVHRSQLLFGSSSINSVHGHVPSANSKTPVATQNLDTAGINSSMNDILDALLTVSDRPPAIEPCPASTPLPDTSSSSYDSVSTYSPRDPARESLAMSDNFPSTHDYASTHSPYDPCFCALLHRLRYAHTGETVTYDTLWAEWVRQNPYERRAMDAAGLRIAYLRQAWALSTTTRASIGVNPYNALVPIGEIPRCPGLTRETVTTIAAFHARDIVKLTRREASYLSTDNPLKRKDRGGYDYAMDGHNSQGMRKLLIVPVKSQK